MSGSAATTAAASGAGRLRLLMALPDRRVRGGPPSHLYELRDTLAGLGVDVRDFLYGGRHHAESGWSKLAGRLADLLAFPLLLLRHRPDLVQLNSAFDRKGVARDVFFVTLARCLGQRVVLKFHGSDLPFLRASSAAWRALAWLVVRGASLVCVLSHEEREAFQARYPGLRVEVVKNALNLERYRPGYDFRARYGIPADRPLLLFIARFIESKGLREVLRAMARLREKHEVHAALVGDGEVRAEMEQLAARLGLASCTTFTGYIAEEDTVSAYLAAELLVFPSYHQEGMPMVVFHSLACGLPVVTTRIRAAADWLSEPDEVVFVPARDHEALAAALRALLDDPERRRRMSERGRQVASRFERRKVAAEFVELYRSLLPPAPAPRSGRHESPDTLPSERASR
jgi:glycosyltransferase involved in cell wall biosynthesis